MKIAILTFQKAINYGAALQAYALQTYIEQLGHEVNILDYSCPYLDQRKYLKSRTGAMSILRKAAVSLLVGRSLKRKADRFHDFSKNYLHIADKCDSSTIERVSHRYDILVVGSDQVWNLTMTGNDTGYFFDFESDDALRVAYAASLGQDNVSQEDLDKIIKLISRFDSISVREESAQRKLMLQSEGINVECVLDPTLMLKEEEWNTLADGISVPRCKYVFVYSLGELGALGTVAKQVAEEYGYKIVCQSPGPRGIPGAINIHDLGPREFLAYLRGASYVIGNSFHGVCLSILLRKQFGFVLSSNGRNSRLKDITKKLGVEDRRIIPGEKLPSELIDYNSVHVKLNAERDLSAQFLKNALIDR